MSIFTPDEVETIFPKKERDQYLVTSEESDDLLSIQAATLSSGDTMQVYSELAVKEPADKDNTLKAQFNQAKVRDSQEEVATMVEVASSSEVDEETREQVINNLAKRQQLGPVGDKKSSVLYAESVMASPSTDSPQEEEVRFSSAAVVDQVVATIERKQKLFNSELLNSGGVESFVDFLEYIIPLDEQIFTGSLASKLGAGEATGYAEAILALGESKTDLKELYWSLPEAEKIKFEEKLLAVVNETTGILFMNDNDLMQKDLFMSIVDPSHYEGGLRTLDNIVSIIDLVGIGSLFSAPLKGVINSVDLAKVKKAMARSGVQPHSAAKVAASTNPSQARVMNIMAIADESGATAKVTHGASREDVVTDAYAPQAGNADGSVDDVIHTPHILPEEIEKTLEETFISYSHEEKVSGQLAEEALFNKLGTGEGAIHRSAAQSVAFYNKDGSTSITNLYTRENAGFESAEEALDIVKGKFRFYDIADEQFTLMRKGTDGQYHPTTIEEVQANQLIRAGFKKAKKKLPEELRKENLINDFAVTVNFKRDFNPAVVKHEDLSYALNWLDRSPVLSAKKQGGASLTRYLFDPMSIFDTRVSRSASVAVEKASALDVQLIKLADEFVVPYKALSKDKQEMAFQMFKEQNLLEKRFTKGEIRAKGFTESEAKIFDDWANMWDTIYALENRDLAITLKNQGWTMVKGGDNAELIGKPLGRGTDVPNGAKIFDPNSGEVITLSRTEVDELYESGGRVHRLRSSMSLDEGDIEFTLTRNTDSSYYKEITKDSKVLSYKEGYYSVRYDDPYFITKVTKDANGNVISTKAVKTGHSLKATERAVKSLNQGAEEGVEYTYRENRTLDAAEREDFEWSLRTNSGRTTQKARGERLGSTLNEESGTIQDPIDSLLSSARSISRRASSRDWLDKMKIRFMEEFKDFIPESGKFPTAPSELKAMAGGTQHSARLGDARTMLEYINYMEYGYKNSIDEGWKGLLNGMAEALGAKSEKAELALRAVADEVNSPTGFLRGRAFDLYLASNPLRQIIVQSHQATSLAANFPEYVLKQGLARDLTAIHTAIVFGEKLLTLDKATTAAFTKSTGKTPKEALALYEEYKATGFDASIDRHNLVEEGLNTMVESTNFKKTKALHKATIGRLRKVGFDAGERVNIMSAWLAYRDRHIKQGGSIDSTFAKDTIIANARNYTFNMNAAGDMPYNKTALSLIFQFMQVPHKAMLTMTTNKMLSKGEKARLAAYNVAALSLPTALVMEIADSFGGLPEDPVARDLVINGIEGTMLNQMAQLAFGDETQLDYSSLSPLDPYGLYELIASFITTDITEILSNAPSLSLFFGHNPRFGALADEVSNLMTEPKPENLESSIKSFLSLSSGYANFSKAYKELFDMEVRQRISNGVISDPSITAGESFGKAFGLPTVEETVGYRVKRNQYLKSQAAIDDAKEYARYVHGLLSRQGMDTSDPNYAAEMAKSLDNAKGFFIVSEFTPKQKTAFFTEIKKKLTNGDDKIFSMIYRNIGLLKPEETISALNNAGFHEEAKAFAESMKMINETAKESKL